MVERIMEGEDRGKKGGREGGKEGRRGVGGSKLPPP